MASTIVTRPTWAQVDLDSLKFNLNSAKSFIGPEIRVMAVVKADAYGHGATPCALALEAAGADWLAVSLPEEGAELRAANVGLPILCLGGFWPGQEGLLFRHNLTPVIFIIEQAAALDHAARERNVSVNIQVKIDTGMGRIGFRHDAVAEVAEQFRGLTNLKIQGLMTHFAAADRLEETPFTRQQIGRFNESVRVFRNKGFDPEMIDLANSPASIAYPESRGNMVRLGGILYGLGDDVLPDEVEKPSLKPVLSLRSRVSLLKRVPAGESLGYGRTFVTKRDSTIATVPIGYHDGYRRNMSNKAKVIVNGSLAPVVGRVSMDWTIIDVTDIPQVELGDEVILIGTSGEHSITASHLAKLIDTISYEITCGISRRVPRLYTEKRD